MGGVSVGLPVNGVARQHHHRSKSTSESSNGERHQSDAKVLGSEAWKYRTVNAMNHSLDRRRPDFEKAALQRASQGMFVTRENAKPEISPFSRSRSRVFYASEDFCTSVPVKTSPMADALQPTDSPRFYRSGSHRNSSGRKSHDSGFSDCVDGAPAGPKRDRSDSPAKKLQKWSSSFPIKALLKAQDLSGGQGHLPKLSMLKCCIGIGPGFYGRDRKVQGYLTDKTSNLEKDTSVVDLVECTDTKPEGDNSVSKNDDSLPSDSLGAPLSASKVEGTGTWPRLRKNKDPTGVTPGTVSPTRGPYHSTRLRNNQAVCGKSMDNVREPHGSHDRKIGRGLNASRSRLTASIRNSSLQQWSDDLKWSTEDECMNTLQGKTVVRDVADVIDMANRNAKDTILTVHGKCAVVTANLAKLKKKVEETKFNQALTICERMSSEVESLLWSCRAHQGNDTSILQYQRLVSAHCSILTQLFERAHRGELNKEDWRSFLDTIYALKSAVTSLSEALILLHMKSIIDVLEEPPSLANLKSVLCTIEILGNHNSSLCRSLAAIGGIRALLTVGIDPRFKTIRARTLRALATLCCVNESIQEVEESGGVECITEILVDETSTEEEKREAAGFIAQITSPALENSHRIEGLAENLRCLIQSLTNLAKSTKSSDSFLLATAALANLTFLNTQAGIHLHRCKTVWILVSTCRKSGVVKTGSVFVKDQVATVLANMSSLPEGRQDVIDSGGLVVLLSFLKVTPSTAGSKAELAACERVQQKSSIALSRLCSDAAVSEQVIALQGVQRLVQLCKDEKERNQSDAVLVACLAALRKIATACGFEEFKDLDAMELVKPRLLDTFLIYSSRQESYV